MRALAVAGILALVALALGTFDAIIERDGGGWLMQIVLPTLLIIVLLGLYAKAKADRMAAEQDLESDTGDVQD